MIGTELVVRATFFRREQVVAQFRRGAWVADHPVNIFGYGKGPTPGDLLLGALTASSALTIAADVPSVSGTPPVVRAIAQTGRRPTDGPLPSILRVDRIVRRVELRGSARAQRSAVERALDRCPVLHSLRSSITVDETLSLDRTTTQPSPHEPNATPLDVSATRGAATTNAVQAPSSEEFGPPGYHWIVSAVHLGGTVAMVRFAPGAQICDTDPGDSALGPSPLEVLLAAVAVGSTTFVGRFSAQQQIPVRRVDITARATVELSSEGVACVRRIHKDVAIGGDLSDEQVERVRFFSANAALTETVRTGAGVQDEVVELPDDDRVGPAVALLDLDQLATTKSRLSPS